MEQMVLRVLLAVLRTMALLSSSDAI